ncbi:DUF742 domain-containing protein [Catellatospora chokoriensis]|uniref:DUF742 domain-containing protein n=1 Tax=Catellatospora chokoriensis TaxID=310353 RepID=A0A8J3NV72_9ACTN|nr:DUF742 domain-containing protein [Catellatospora chokoriensis]GIF93626.1 hypothetical protein Cch02nite_70700 [Catellatospora chokoriensis]
MPFPEPTDDDTWVDEEAGPVVRPYALTSGRTRPAKGTFDLVSLVAATQPITALSPGRSPEQLAIVRMSQQRLSVAEIAAHLDLSINIVRVLLGDLLQAELITVHHAQPIDDLPYNDAIYEAMLDGLRAL